MLYWLIVKKTMIKIIIITESDKNYYYNRNHWQKNYIFIYSHYHNSLYIKTDERESKGEEEMNIIKKGDFANIAISHYSRKFNDSKGNTTGNKLGGYITSKESKRWRIRNNKDSYFGFGSR